MMTSQPTSSRPLKALTGLRDLIVHSLDTPPSLRLGNPTPRTISLPRAMLFREQHRIRVDTGVVCFHPSVRFLCKYLTTNPAVRPCTTVERMMTKVVAAQSCASSVNFTWPVR